MYRIELRDEFTAVHAVRMPGGDWETPHAHRWQVRVFIGSGTLDRYGMVADFGTVSKHLRSIIDPLEGQDLNRITELRRCPTAELIARYIFDQLACRLAERGVAVTAVAIRETDNCWAWYQPTGVTFPP